MNSWVYPLAHEPNLKRIFTSNFSANLASLFGKSNMFHFDHFLLNMQKTCWIQKGNLLREAADLSQNTEEQGLDLLGRAPVSLNAIRVGLSLSPQAYATWYKLQGIARIRALACGPTSMFFMFLFLSLNR